MDKKLERAMLQADIIAVEAIKKLGGRKFKNLTLEEALEIKELADLGAKGAYPGIRELSVGLDEYVKSPYGLEAARDQVEALDAAYKHKSKLHKEMEELKVLLETNGRDIGMAKSAPFSFGEDKHARYSFIKRAEEGSKMMIEELEQKTKEIHLVDAGISRLISEIGRLKGAYLSEHPRPDANISWVDKMIAWGKLRNAQQAAAREAASARSKMGGLQRRNFRREEEEAAGAAMRWAERMQGAVFPPPPPADRRAASPPRESRGVFAARLRSVQRANKQARNTAELNALRALNRRESRNAAAAIFSNKSKKNKPKWGIPNLGTGFGGGRTRRRVGSRKRRGLAAA